MITSGPTAAHFRIPFSVEAFAQFQQVEHLVQNWEFVDERDVWFYTWGSHTFTTKKSYNHVMETCSAHPIFKWIWKSSCQHKHKVFFWLLSKDRVSTRNILKREKFPPPLLWLCALWWLCGRYSGAPLHRLWSCQGVWGIRLAWWWLITMTLGKLLRISEGNWGYHSSWKL